MTEDTRKFVEEKTKEILNAGSCCPELKEMAELEKKVAFMIDMGFVIDQTQLMLALRKIYNDKYRKF